jgi:hypothetical protein
MNWKFDFSPLTSDMIAVWLVEVSLAWNDFAWVRMHFSMLVVCLGDAYSSLAALWPWLGTKCRR